MKQVIRYADKLGRIVLPRDFREKAGIREGTPLAIAEENGTIFIRVAQALCPLCGEVKEDGALPLCFVCIRFVKSL